jgi:hypothetical protein
MFSRFGLYLITFVLALAACGGDDSESGTNPVGASGSGGQSGSAGRAGASGRSRGSGGRTALPGGQTCPVTEAEAVGACTTARGTCTFGMRTCDCVAGSNTWACWSASDCPASVPAERSSCPVVGMTCSPGGRGNCSCTAMGWSCGNQYCPPTEPAAGGMCENGAGRCSYGAGVCECASSAWTCWDPATACPATPPPDRASCSANGAICDYPGGNCTCNAMTGWRCGRGVMNDQDAGVPMGGASAAPISGAGGR